MLYHRQIGFPSVALPVGRFQLKWTDHALHAAETDRNGEIRLEATLTIDQTRIFEIETNQAGQLVKVMYRTRHDARNDVIYALLINPDGVSLGVKTVWLNRRSDRHFTLNHGKYNRP